MLDVVIDFETYYAADYTLSTLTMTEYLKVLKTFIHSQEKRR